MREPRSAARRRARQMRKLLKRLPSWLPGKAERWMSKPEYESLQVRLRILEGK